MLTITPDDDFQGATFNVNGKYMILDWFEIQLVYHRIQEDIIELGVKGPYQIKIGDDTEVLEETEWRLAHKTAKYIVNESCKDFINELEEEKRLQSLH